MRIPVQASFHLEADIPSLPEAHFSSMVESKLRGGLQRLQSHLIRRIAISNYSDIRRLKSALQKSGDWEKCQSILSQEKFKLMHSRTPRNYFLGHKANHFPHKNGGEGFCRGQRCLAIGDQCQGMATFQTKSDCITDLSLVILQLRNWSRRLLWWYSWFIWNRNVMLNIYEFWASCQMF